MPTPSTEGACDWSETSGDMQAASGRVAAAVQRCSIPGPAAEAAAARHTMSDSERGGRIGTNMEEIVQNCRTTDTRVIIKARDSAGHSIIAAW